MQKAVMPYFVWGMPRRKMLCLVKIKFKNKK